MSFTLDPTVPADSETPRNGASRIRSLTSETLQLFGENGSVAETYALPPIASVDKTTGLATVQGVPTVSLGIATKGYVDASTPSNVFTGSAAGTNTITSTLAPVPANQAALAGLVILLRIANTNTGATTFNPNGLGALAVVKNGNNALTGGELLAGAWVELVYDATNTNYQIIDQFLSVPLATQARVVKTVDQSVTSSTSLTNDNVLLFAIAANETWQFEFHLHSTMSATGGLDIAVTVPAGGSVFYDFAAGSTNSIGSVTSGGRVIVFLTSVGIANGVTKVYGSATNGATPGSVALQFSQDASDGTATTIKANSTLLAWRINP